MANKKVEKEDSVRERLDVLGREMTTQSILFHQAIAESAGLSGTDHKFIDLFFQHGSMTAGKLAKLTGLTTGATTGVIDRLEKKKLVRRERNPNDRRQVLVVLNEKEAQEKIGPAFKHMQEGLESLYQGFSESDLAIVEEFMIRTITFYKTQIEQIKSNR